MCDLSLLIGPCRKTPHSCHQYHPSLARFCCVATRPLLKPLAVIKYGSCVRYLYFKRLVHVDCTKSYYSNAYRTAYSDVKSLRGHEREAYDANEYLNLQEIDNETCPQRRNEIETCGCCKLVRGPPELPFPGFIPASCQL